MVWSLVTSHSLAVPSTLPEAKKRASGVKARSYTKSVWPLQCPGAPEWNGPSCEDADYLAWLRSLEAAGFEIGYHGATCGDDTRDTIERAIARFRELFGGPPAVFANHSETADAIYWGPKRVSGLARPVYALMTRFKTSGRFKGEVEGSPHFWGDLCREHVEFVRNFVYADVNTLRACPQMPYHDADRPYVRAWFASSDGGNANSFCKLLATENQERLVRERGVCIVYTHFAKGFLKDGAVRDDVRARLEELSQRNGWFTTTGELLRFLRDRRGGLHALTHGERRRLEWRWLRHKMLLGST